MLRYRPHSLRAANAMRFKRQLRGDLDNVVLKALAEEPNRRYASASAFADDLERYLAGRPVAAHPASTWYRTTKFVRRHRGGVVVAAAAVIAVAASMGLVVWQARVANAEAKRASAVRDFVESIFAPLSNGTPESKQPRISELLASATDRMDKADLDAAARVDLVDVRAFEREGRRTRQSASVGGPRPSTWPSANWDPTTRTRSMRSCRAA